MCMFRFGWLAFSQIIKKKCLPFPLYLSPTCIPTFEIAPLTVLFSPMFKYTHLYLYYLYIYISYITYKFTQFF